MPKTGFALFLALFLTLGTCESHAQEKNNMVKIPFDFVFQSNKASYGPSFTGFALGVGIERYIYEQLSIGISIQSIQNFTRIGIVPFLYFNPEMKYYLKVKNFRGMYIGASFGYGFDVSTRYMTYAPQGGYMFYIAKFWYLDSNITIGSGKITKVDEPAVGNSDGLHFRAGLKLCRTF